MTEQIMGLLIAEFPGADIHLTQTQFIPRKGWLIRWETASPTTPDSPDWNTHDVFGFVRMTGAQDGTVVLEWYHLIGSTKVDAAINPPKVGKQ